MKLESCYRVVKPVDIQPILDVVDKLEFFHANQGGATPDRYACDVVLRIKFPKVVNEFIENLGLGGEVARAIFRRLPPRQSIPPHIDKWMPAEANWSRFQVPIISDPSIIMGWPEKHTAVYLKPGFLYEVRYDITHEVVNSWDGERIHLQIDQVDATI